MDVNCLCHLAKHGTKVILRNHCLLHQQCFLLFPQGLPISMYGGTLIPSHPQLADGPGGPLFNGLHSPDPAWNPMIKVVQNSAECTDAQQVVWLTFTTLLTWGFLQCCALFCFSSFSGM